MSGEGREAVRAGGDEEGRFYIDADPDKPLKVSIKRGRFPGPPDEQIVIHGVPPEDVSVEYCWFGTGQAEAHLQERMEGLVAELRKRAADCEAERERADDPSAAWLMAGWADGLREAIYLLRSVLEEE